MGVATCNGESGPLLLRYAIPARALVFYIASAHFCTVGTGIHLAVSGDDAGGTSKEWKKN